MNNRYKLEITGKNIKRFIEDMIKNKIRLYSINTSKNKCIIIVDEEGYKKLIKRKSRYEVKKIREYGLVRYKSLFNKYLIFIISLIITFMFIKILSCMIFDIKVEHSKEEIRSLVLNDLEEFGIRKYYFKVDKKKREEIKRKILEKETEKIEWIEITEVGTKYIIDVEERVKNKIKNENVTQNIVAKRDAMILEISAEHGEIRKKKYDYVKKGDVLISGVIMNKDKPMKKVKAKGKAYGEVWYKVEVEMPINYEEVKYTGNKRKLLEFKVFNKSIFLFNNKYNQYKVKRKELFSNKIIPISINYSRVSEVKIRNKTYNISNIDNDAIKYAEKKINDKDKVIYKKVLKKRVKNSKIIVDIFFKVKEDITDYENIDKVKLEDIEVGDEGDTGN